MPLQKLTLRPGINVQRTQLLNEGGWSNCNCIRFRDGSPETLGGWVALGSPALNGTPRGTHAWATLAGIPTIGVGTATDLYIIQGTSLYDITPIVAITAALNPFTTMTSSAAVTVSDPQVINPQVGQVVLVSGATAVGGLTLSGAYSIATVTGPTTYTITASSQASGNATGGGVVTFQYLLAPGNQSATFADGWGTGTWGTGTWGTPRGLAGLSQPPRIWTLDNFGEQLIANPRGGGIYVWQPSLGPQHRATLIAGAPTEVSAIFVSNAAEQIIALGSAPAEGGAFDPMLVSWCNSADYNTWIASATNDAGNFQLTDGSQLMWGCRAAQQNLLWTDTALYSMQFVGALLGYAFTQIGSACGMISPQSAAFVNGVAYWMTRNGFRQYNGSVLPLDCSVWDDIFKNLSTSQLFKINCGVNSEFYEIRWDYPSLNGAGEVDSYVIFNYAENTWTLGSDLQSTIIAGQSVLVSRSAWVDVSAFGNPVGFDVHGNVWMHENEGVYNAGTLAMPWSLESSYADISAGRDMMFVDWQVLDQIMTGGTIGLTLSAQRYSADTPTTVSGNFTSATEYLNLRIRGRQVALTFQNSTVPGGFWRLGAVRFRAALDGRN